MQTETQDHIYFGGVSRGKLSQTVVVNSAMDTNTLPSVGRLRLAASYGTHCDGG